MKVILLKNVQNLGKQGEIKEVSLGYARNFLIPKGLADTATNELIAQLESRRQKETKRAELDLIKTEELAGRLEGSVVNISSKVTDQGTLYAAVTPAKISSALKTKGFNIFKEQVMTAPIKEVGEHEVVIKLDHGLETKIMVIIEEEKV